MMTLEPLWTRAFCLLTGSHLLGALGYASMLLLPLYLTFLGGSRAEVGMIMSSAHLAGLATRPIVGWSLDRFGRRSSLIFGAVVTALSLAGVYFIHRIGYHAYAIRILFGIGEGFIFTGYFAFAADLIPSSRRTEGLALFGVAGLLPLLVNPIADFTGFQGGDLRLFLSSVSILILFSAIMIILIPRSVEQENKGDQESDETETGHRVFEHDVSQSNVKVENSASGTLIYLLAPRMRPLWWSTLAFAGAVALLMTFGSVVSSARGMSYPTAVWFTYVGGAVMARLFGAKLPEKLGPSRLVSPSLALYGFALLIYAQSVEVWGMLLAGALAGVAHGYCFPVLTSLIVSAVDERYRGRALAMFTGLWGGAAVIFAPLGGWIADYWSDDKMLLFFGFLLICASVYARPNRFNSLASNSIRS